MRCLPGLPLVREICASLLAVALAACGQAPATGAAALPTAAAAIQPHTESFTSQGRAIGVDWFPAQGRNGPAPAVLVLHGAEGFTTGGTDYTDAARLLASHGYHAFVVHYFDRTGDSFVLRRTTIVRRLPVWQATVQDALGHVARHADVDPQQLALLGASLGGGLAVLTARNNPQVKAVVDYFGFYPDELKPADRFPPILLLHGGRDTVLPAAEHGERLHRFLDANRSPNQLHIYPAATHGFRNDPATRADAARRSLAFLNTYLP